MFFKIISLHILYCILQHVSVWDGYPKALSTAQAMQIVNYAYTSRHFCILKSQSWVQCQDRQMPHQPFSELDPGQLRAHATLSMWQHGLPSGASICLMLPGLPAGSAWLNSVHIYSYLSCKHCWCRHFLSFRTFCITKKPVPPTCLSTLARRFLWKHRA